jgi:AcrR family transcriptional regulator
VNNVTLINKIIGRGVVDMGEYAPAHMERHLWDCLILSAQSCLHGKSHLEITSRDIAEGAGTHASMVNYYFNNKNGLFSALISTTMSVADSSLRQIEHDIEAKTGDPTEIIVRGLVRAYPLGTPSMSVGIIEIFRQRSEIKEAYARRRSKSISHRIEKQIRKLIARGDYRRDLDPVSTTWMILCLVIGLHVVEPFERAAGRNDNTPDPENWIHAIAEMLRKHVAADQSPKMCD